MLSLNFDLNKGYGTPGTTSYTINQKMHALE